MKPRSCVVFAAVIAVMGALAQAPFDASAPALPAHPISTPTALQLLREPIADTVPDADQVRRGQALVVDGDCLSCHLREGGEPFAGGRGLDTPFGVIYSANITPDAQTGIGEWTSDQFYRAMHDGIDARGENLYPAFPYPWFRRASRADDDAIFAFLKTIAPVSYTPPKNKLPTPLNFRFLVKGWNLLFLDSHEHEQATDAAESVEWNRGAYLVRGLAHCGGCHTPKNMLGADKSGEELHGGKLEHWVAPDLTGNSRTGLGAWSIDDIDEFLRTGRNGRAGAGAAMAEVVMYSTSLMSDADRHAIAVYLKSRPASAAPQAPSAPDQGVMRRGAAIYSDACSACHFDDGVGQPRFFPPLANNALLQQADAAGVEHLILAGSRLGASPSRPSPLAMPSFAWKLSDGEIADVATFIRNSWGNQAGAVSASEVADLRHKLGLETVRLTVNSGDRR